MDCGDNAIHVKLALLPPAIDPKTVFDTLRMLSRQDDDKAVMTMVTIPHKTLTQWQLVTTSAPSRMTLSTLFIDGRPVAANLVTRFHEAWHSLRGGHHAQQIIAVSAPGAASETRSTLFHFIEQGEFMPVKLAALTKEAANP